MGGNELLGKGLHSPSAFVVLNVMPCLAFPLKPGVEKRINIFRSAQSQYATPALSAAMGHKNAYYEKGRTRASVLCYKRVVLGILNEINEQTISKKATLP